VSEVHHLPRFHSVEDFNTFCGLLSSHVRAADGKLYVAVHPAYLGIPGRRFREWVAGFSSDRHIPLVVLAQWRGKVDVARTLRLLKRLDVRRPVFVVPTLQQNPEPLRTFGGWRFFGQIPIKRVFVAGDVLEHGPQAFSQQEVLEREREFRRQRLDDLRAVPYRGKSRMAQVHEKLPPAHRRALFRRWLRHQTELRGGCVGGTHRALSEMGFRSVILPQFSRPQKGVPAKPLHNAVLKG